MNSKFFDLKKEKQDRMINAALKVFALNGYRHASTDEIVKEAMISKGLLFHYFTNKIGLYLFIYDYSVRFMSLELNSFVSKTETNLFTIFKQIEYARMQAMRGYPYMQLFLNRSMTEDVSEVLVNIEEMRELLICEYDKIYAQIDYNLITSNVIGKQLLNMIDFTTKGLLSERFFDASFQPEMLYQEMTEYLEIMEEAFTK